jgi:hypothetical protein
MDADDPRFGDGSGPSRREGKGFDPRAARKRCGVGGRARINDAAIGPGVVIWRAASNAHEARSSTASTRPNRHSVDKSPSRRSTGQLRVASQASCLARLLPS